MTEPVAGSAPHPYPLPSGEGRGEGSAKPDRRDLSAVAYGAKADRRLYIWWGAAFALLGLLGVFCWFFVRPYLEVRAAVGRFDPSTAAKAKEVEAMGGPEKAAAKIGLYLRCPEMLASDREKRWAFAILHECGKSAIPCVERLLSSRNASVRENAAEEVGQLMHPPRAVELLVSALRDPVADVRYSAVRGLGIFIYEPQKVEPLIAVLEDRHARVRKEAARALGRERDSRAVKPLISLLKDPDDDVRSEVVRALDEIGDARAVEPLIGALCDSAFTVRFEAVRSLGNLRAGRAVEPLMTRLYDANELVRSAAAEALKKIEAAEAAK